MTEELQTERRTTQIQYSPTFSKRGYNETIAYNNAANLCHTVNILNFKHFSLSVLN